jgi:hypothetical protein
MLNKHPLFFYGQYQNQTLTKHFYQPKTGVFFKEWDWVMYMYFIPGLNPLLSE